MYFIFEIRRGGLLQELMPHHVIPDSRHFLYDVRLACLGGSEAESGRNATMILFIEMLRLYSIHQVVKLV